MPNVLTGENLPGLAGPAGPWAWGTVPYGSRASAEARVRTRPRTTARARIGAASRSRRSR